jgi:hypothetical protein
MAGAGPAAMAGRRVPVAVTVATPATVGVRVRWRCSARAGPVASVVPRRVVASVVLAVLAAHPG